MEHGAQIALREFGVTLAEKTSKTVYSKWFGAFFWDPFWATIFWPERSHAAWCSFFFGAGALSGS